MLLATGYFNVDFRTPILIYLTISQIKKFFVNSISDQFLTELIRLPVTFGMGFRYLYKPVKFQNPLSSRFRFIAPIISTRRSSPTFFFLDNHSYNSLFISFCWFTTLSPPFQNKKRLKSFFLKSHYFHFFFPSFLSIFIGDLKVFFLNPPNATNYAPFTPICCCYLTMSFGTTRSSSGTSKRSRTGCGADHAPEETCSRF